MSMILAVGFMAILLAGGGAVSLVGAAVGDDILQPATASCSFTFGTDGAGTFTGNLSPASTPWFTPLTAGIGSSYWVKVTLNTGTAPGGDVTGSWLALSSARSWSLTRAINGTVSNNLTVQIASDAAGANVVATATFTMTATRNP